MPPVVLHFLLGKKLQASSHGLMGELRYLLTSELNFNNIFKALSISQMVHARAVQGAVAI